VPTVGDLGDDLPALAQTAIGQRDVRATPLQMALVAAAVANDGESMRPHLVDAILDDDGAVVDQISPRLWRTAMEPGSAADLAAMMEGVVEAGTGRAAAVPGLRVAGKTGTAEAGGDAPHAWFIGFAPVDAAPGEASIAVAVLVESGGALGDRGSGGTVAAPIARAVFEAWLRYSR
jgi:peptidoglycan glycosyltransferase